MSCIFLSSHAIQEGMGVKGHEGYESCMNIFEKLWIFSMQKWPTRLPRPKILSWIIEQLPTIDLHAVFISSFKVSLSRYEYLHSEFSLLSVASSTFDISCIGHGVGAENTWACVAKKIMNMAAISLIIGVMMGLLKLRCGCFFLLLCTYPCRPLFIRGVSKRSRKGACSVVADCTDVSWVSGTSR